MSKRSNGHKRADLYSFRDLDLMLTLQDRGDEEGWAPTHDLASSFGFGDELSGLGIRLGWMRHYGMVERKSDKGESLWRLTDGGLRVTEAKTAAAHKTIGRIPDEALVEVMSDITARFTRGDAMLATMLRREFAYGTARR